MAFGASRLVSSLLPCVLLVAAASAVSAGPPSSSPVLDLPRFDVSAGGGWFSGTFGPPPQGRNWYHDAAWWGGQFGCYWTENVKLEAEVSASGDGRGWSSDEGTTPSGRPFYVYREHGLSARTASIGLLYQFGHNLMLHPFVGAGVDVDFTRDRVVTAGYYYGGDRVPAEPLPPVAEETIAKTRAGAFALVGVKAYFSERVFLRGDFKAGTSGAERKTVLRIGLGVDF